jgi:hypothetical protein
MANTVFSRKPLEKKKQKEPVNKKTRMELQTWYDGVRLALVLHGRAFVYRRRRLMTGLTRTESTWAC